MTDQSVPTVEHWLATRKDEVEVLSRFIDAMQRELAANSGKGDRAGWMSDTPRSLLAEVQHHYVKLHAAVVEFDRWENDEFVRRLPWQGHSDYLTLNELLGLIREFAADVANMAMMAADRCGALGDSPEEERHAA